MSAVKAHSQISLSSTGSSAARLLAWYDRHRRALPWRALPGRRPDPYHVWLSEVMLQQTTVATVGPYFRKFIETWPSVGDLAAAPREAVLTAWAGLGYYARARNLHACAEVVAEQHGGIFPDNEAELRRLPGIGAYTAAAIAAIAFDRPAVVVDGNVERVTARLFAVETPLPDAKPALKSLAAELFAAAPAQDRPGDFAQAMMDLGATVCTPRKPRCILCPMHGDCDAAAIGNAEDLPRKKPKKQKPIRRGHAFWLIDGRGRILLRRRPDQGLLGGMTEIPGSDWQEAAPPPDPPCDASWQELPGTVRHIFTHFQLEVTVHAAKLDTAPPPPSGGFWAEIDALGDHALPSVMRKIVRHAMKHSR